MDIETANENQESLSTYLTKSAAYNWRKLSNGLKIEKVTKNYEKINLQALIVTTNGMIWKHKNTSNVPLLATVSEVCNHQEAVELQDDDYPGCNSSWSILIYSDDEVEESVYYKKGEWVITTKKHVLNEKK